jgi:hypothetical protein
MNYKVIFAGIGLTSVAHSAPIVVGPTSAHFHPPSGTVITCASDSNKSPSWNATLETLDTDDCRDIEFDLPDDTEVEAPSGTSFVVEHGHLYTEKNAGDVTLYVTNFGTVIALHETATSDELAGAGMLR